MNADDWSTPEPDWRTPEEQAKLVAEIVELFSRPPAPPKPPTPDEARYWRRSTPEVWHEGVRQLVEQYARREITAARLHEEVGAWVGRAEEYGLDRDEAQEHGDLAVMEAKRKRRKSSPPPEPTPPSDGTAATGRAWTAADLYEHGPEPTKGFVEGEAFSEQSVTLIVGMGGAGKTMLAAAMGAAHVHGAKLGPLQFSKGRVLYVSKEMSEAAMRRRLRRQFTLGEVQALGDAFEFRCRPEGLDLYGDPERAAAILREFIEQQKATLAFLDALSDCHSGDENSNREMGLVFRTLRDKVAEPTGACVVPLHHAGWPVDGRTPRPRGASVMRDISEDLLIIDQPKKDGPRRVTWDKTRWEPLARFGYAMRKDEESGLVRLEVFPWSEKDGSSSSSSSERREQDRILKIAEEALALLKKHGRLKKGDLRERIECRNEDLGTALGALENQRAARWVEDESKKRVWEAV